MLFAGAIRTSDKRHGSVGEMYANQRHMVNADVGRYCGKGGGACKTNAGREGNEKIFLCSVSAALWTLLVVWSGDV